MSLIINIESRLKNEEKNRFSDLPGQIPKDKYKGGFVAGRIFLTMLLLLFVCAANCKAQELKIGDKVPDLNISDVINFPTNNIKISEFKGKVVIIDFWATWCAPCVMMIPKMEKLQKEFDGQVQFLPVTYQTEKEVKAFQQKINKASHSNLPEVVNDVAL